MKEAKVFAGNASRELGREISKRLGLALGDMEVASFSDGEISITINESVRGADVFIVQSTCAPVNTNIMELLIAIDAFKRASAGRITAVMPYFGYARQDRKAKARDPISAKLVADIIEAAGAHRVLTMDLHAAQIQGFFDIPVDHLLGVPLLSPYFKDKFAHLPREQIVVVSPDMGSVTRARNFASRLDATIAIVDKRRPRANVSEVMNIIGDVNGKVCIIVDDMVDTAGTLCQAAEALKARGALEVYACATHGVLSGPAIERIQNCSLKELVLLDTIPLPAEKQIDKIRMLGVAGVFAEAIDRIYQAKPVSPLFV
jgi:ribose-phosphate pyrophosphokinase